MSNCSTIVTILVLEVGTTNMINETQPNSKKCVPMNVPFEKPAEKFEKIFLYIESFSDIGATFFFSNIPNCNAMKLIFHSLFIYDFKQDADNQSPLETNILHQSQQVSRTDKSPGAALEFRF